MRQLLRSEEERRKQIAGKWHVQVCCVKCKGLCWTLDPFLYTDSPGRFKWRDRYLCNDCREEAIDKLRRRW
jgi:hypothetical protein